MTHKVMLSEGVLVRHPKKREWGLGKVLVVNASNMIVFFKDDSADYRKFLLTGVQLEIAEIQSDPVLDNLPPFIDGAFTAKGSKVTIQDGMEEFKRLFPLGFEDPRYLGGERVGVVGERNFKVHAHECYLAAFGQGRGPVLLAEGKYDDLRDKAQAVATAGKVALLSPYEVMAFRDGLVSSDSVTREFFDALFKLVNNGPNQTDFDSLANAVKNIPVEKGRARAATWPIQTIFPFLADPTKFIFLKPEPTKACADRLRFDLGYDSALRWETYERVLEMGALLLEELRPLGAKDFIDVQSFMWVIEKY